MEWRRPSDFINTIHTNMLKTNPRKNIPSEHNYGKNLPQKKNKHIYRMDLRSLVIIQVFKMNININNMNFII